MDLFLLLIGFLISKILSPLCLYTSSSVNTDSDTSVKGSRSMTQSWSYIGEKFEILILITHLVFFNKKIVIYIKTFPCTEISGDLMIHTDLEEFVCKLVFLCILV